MTAKDPAQCLLCLEVYVLAVKGPICGAGWFLYSLAEHPAKKLNIWAGMNAREYILPSIGIYARSCKLKEEYRGFLGLGSL